MKTKIEEFTDDETKRRAIEQVLPLIREGLEALKEELEAGKTNEGLANPVIGNGYFQQIVGARYLITNLERLTRIVKKVKPPEPRRQFTEADREMLAQRLKETQDNG